MKILVFADFHGSVSGLQTAVKISQREQPDKTVICGDLFGFSSSSQVAQIVLQLYGVTYLVRGNNDRPYDEAMLPCPMEDSAVMYHFNRTLFFTHGDRYNALAVPPILKPGDALIHGHTHAGSLRVVNGLFVLNVGSVCRPRNDIPSYLVLDELGATLKQPDGEILQAVKWN